MNTAEIKSQITVQELANAFATGQQCSGHHKAAMNERLVEQYKEELMKHGISIPSDKELAEQGVYNGQGSY